MSLILYIRPLDFTAVFVHLQITLRLFGVLLLVPLGVALLTGEYQLAFIFAGLCLVALVIGHFRIIAWTPDLESREALVVTALTYLLFALLATPPFLTTTSFVNGLFEAMSGITTTGLSVLSLKEVPTSLLFFRAYLQWLGGAGIIVLSLIILVGPGKAAFRLYASEFGKENLMGSVIATARVVMVIYCLLTAAGFLVYLGVGMAPFDALLYIMATISTGGFAPYKESVGHFGGGSAPAIQAAVLVFMVLGAISFPLYYQARMRGIGHFFRDPQLRGLLVLIVVGFLLLAGVRRWQDHGIHWLFTAASAATTTGFSLSAPAKWPASTHFIAVLLMLIGGTAGSTAGGLKIFRVLIMGKLALNLLLRALLPPEATLATKLGGIAVSEAEIRHIFGFLVLYLFVLCISSLIFILAGFSADAAVFENASALGTVGLSAGVTSPQLAVGLKLLLAFNMWAGRIEILPVLVALYPNLWWWKRRLT
jgi:trk system potassium uptake protein TrkH